MPAGSIPLPSPLLAAGWSQKQTHPASCRQVDLFQQHAGNLALAQAS